MRIWLINPYGPLPDEGWREYYFTTMGKTLAQMGHKVTWWTSNFSHHFKRYRATKWSHIDVCDGFRIVLVPATSYSSHVGIMRYVSEVCFAVCLLGRSGSEEVPNLIIGGDSPQPASCLSLMLARRFRARLFLTSMDQWPELFEMVFPAMLRGLAPRLLSPLYMIRRAIRRRADAIVSLSVFYLQRALAEAQNGKPIGAITVYNGIDVLAFRRSLLRLHGTKVPGLTVEKPESEIWAVFAGTLGNNYDIGCIVQAAVLLREKCKSLKVMIAGAGPCLELIRSGISQYGLVNLIYLGVLSQDDLLSLYGQADIALCAYGRGSNVGMPDKLYDYMAAGLPVINSLSGEVKELIENRDIGQQYTPGDPVSLANAMIQLAEDQELRQRQARSSYQAALSYDREVQFGKLANLITNYGGSSCSG
jgi:glycosyltransferase involved in cell wall biosynthesis